VAEDARFKLARGCPSTPSKSADRHSPTAATVRGLLVAGDKSGQWDKWYRTAIPRAE